MKIIEFQDVSKTYGWVVALSDLNIELPKGIIGMIGPNGAGKSTAIKIIMGELRPSLGQVRVLGEDPFDNPTLRKRVGYVSERVKLFEWATAHKFLTLMARLYGYSRHEAKRVAMSSLQAMELEAFAHKPIATFSKGMRQRVKIATTLFRENDLLILDEPLSGLDPLSRITLMNFFKEQHANGTSILVSSHILFEIQDISTHLMLLYNGKTIAFGSKQGIRQLLSDYPYTYQITVDREHSSIFVSDLYNSQLLESIVFGNSPDKEKSVLICKTKKPKELQSIVLETIQSRKYIQLHTFTDLEENMETESIFEYLVRS